MNIILFISTLLIAKSTCRSLDQAVNEVEKKTVNETAVVFIEGDVDEGELNREHMKKIRDPSMLRRLILKCAAQNDSIPFFKSAHELECHPIGAEEPCPKGEWLVLDEGDQDEFPWSKCVENKCDDYPGRIEAFDDCLPIGLKGICNDGMEIRANVHGKGECACEDGFLTITDRNGIYGCFQEFTRGHCDEDRRLIERAGAPICVLNDCPRANQTRWANGECLFLPECNGGLVEMNDAGKLRCQVFLRQLISIPDVCGDDESKNNNGECVEARRRGLGVRSSISHKLALTNKTLAKFMCRRYPEKFDC